MRLVTALIGNKFEPGIAFSGSFLFGTKIGEIEVLFSHEESPFLAEICYNVRMKSNANDMNTIDFSIPVAQVVDNHPEVLDILVDLGFKPLANPLMRNTVGKKVSIRQGAGLQGINLEKIRQTLEYNGYEVVG